MSKPHINDLQIFKLLTKKIGGYESLSIVCEILKEINNGK